MYLQRKLDEMKVFIAHTTGISRVAHEIIQPYIDKWGDDMRKELGLAFKPGASIGISCDDTVHLTKVPEGLWVKEGIYTSNDGTVKVEVTGQDPVTGTIQMEVTHPDATEIRLEAMTAHLFIRLFKEEPIV